MSSSSGCLSSNFSTIDFKNINVHYGNKYNSDKNQDYYDYLRKIKCKLHGKALINSYQQVIQHLSSPVIVQNDSSDYKSIDFWMNSICNIFDDDDEDEGLSCLYSCSNSDEDDDNDTIMDINPKIQSIFDANPKNKNTIFRNDEVISNEHAFHLEELEYRISRGIEPPKPHEKKYRKWKLTPMNKREIPCQSFAAKYILENVPESCMTKNFYYYHKTSLFFGDINAKGVNETYPYNNKDQAHPIINNEGQYIGDETLKRCFDSRRCFYCYE